MNPTASSVDVLVPTFPSWCSEKNMNPTASSVEVLVPSFPSWCSEKNMNPTASSVDVLVPTFPSWCSEKNMNPTASSVEVLVPSFQSWCSEKNMNPTASSVEVSVPTFPSWCSEKNMNPTASSVDVLVPKPIPKFVFKFSTDKLIIKENPSDQNPVISKALGKNSSITESENEIKRLETCEKNSKSQVERKRNVSPEAEKSKSKKRRMMVSLELSEERIIADVLAMTEGKPLRRPKKNKSLVGMIHNHFTPGAMFASKKEFYPHSFPQFMDTFLHDTGDD